MNILVVYAHPYPQRSRANSALLEAIHGLPDLSVQNLYDLYPDFAIDVEAEQEKLAQADLIVWQHPLYWYGMPALLKHYFDKVLAFGWAYGDGAAALRDKVCQWVVTTGGTESAYGEGEMHGFAFSAFVPPMQQTARFCKMRWQEPIVVHAAHRLSEIELANCGERYRTRLEALYSLPSTSTADTGENQERILA